MACELSESFEIIKRLKSIDSKKTTMSFYSNKLRITIDNKKELHSSFYCSDFKIILERIYLFLLELLQE